MKKNKYNIIQDISCYIAVISDFIAIYDVIDDVITAHFARTASNVRIPYSILSKNQHSNKRLGQMPDAWIV